MFFTHHTSAVQWDFCARRNAIIADNGDGDEAASSTGGRVLADDALLALGAAAADQEAGTAAAYSSEPCSRVVL